MNRRYTKEDYLALVDRIKEAKPNISLTTDIIVGFPGETEEDFEETLDVIRKVKFDSAYTFLYSKRSGTPAATMDNQVEESIAKERFNRLLKEVKNSSSDTIKKAEGSIQSILVEEVNEQNKLYLTGRLSNNILVHFSGKLDMIGTIVKIKLKECKGFYYIGELV
jgi:tRNA-2-methylthio-N6-dimethylallyladenosine synthase